MGLFEPHHLILILVIALIVFGPGKIGDLGGTLGRGLRDFKKAMHEETPPAPAAPVAQVREAQPAAGAGETPAQATAAAEKHVA